MKKLCKISKNGIKKSDVKEFAELVKDAQYYCKKCGRVSYCKDSLCKEKKLPE